MYTFYTSGDEEMAEQRQPLARVELLQGTLDLIILQTLRVTIASESKDESGEAVSRARPSAKEIERVLAADKA